MFKWLIIVKQPDNYETPTMVYDYAKEEQRDAEFDKMIADIEKHYDIKMGKSFHKAQITEWAEETAKIVFVRTKVSY
jgi:hypothetical protein